MTRCSGILERRSFTVADRHATGPGLFEMLGGLVQGVHGLAMLEDRSGVEIPVIMTIGSFARPELGTTVGGGSDANFTAALRVPTLDWLGAVGGGAHADHEELVIDAMLERAELVAWPLQALGNA